MPGFVRHLSHLVAAALLVGLAAGAAKGETVLAPLFSDGAVLQRDKPVAVWGTGDAGEEVSVSFAGQVYGTRVDADGSWTVLLNPLPASTAGSDLLVTAGKQTLVVHDVVVGDVWLCSGGSNLEFAVNRTADAQREMAATNLPWLRLVRVERRPSDRPQAFVGTSGWRSATPLTVGDFSAVAYSFARELQPKLGIPIGIVIGSCGGASIEAWLSPMAVAANPGLRMRERWDETVAAYPKAKAEFDAQRTNWTKAEATAKARGAKALATWRRQNPAPLLPPAPGDPPTSVFDGMINPLVPFGIRGFLWYQGGTNTDRPGEYHALFATLVSAWRAHFGQGDLPFFWVSLPSERAPGDESGRSLAFLREAQSRTLSLSNTGEAIAADLGHPGTILPADPEEVGRRLALLAKRQIYGFMADDKGPSFAGVTREGAALRVRFVDVGSGLVAHDRPPQALELAGPDHVFYPAAGRIDKDTLLVTSPRVRDPVAVRYAFTNAPDANLYSGAGLPVVPFRSDRW